MVLRPPPSSPEPYDNGAQIAVLELEIASSGTGQPTYRLYRVISN